MKPGVITRKDKKYPNGSIRWSSQLPMMKGISLPIAARDVVEPAAKCMKRDRATIRMENIVKQRDMVLKMPYPPPFFNDEPLIPSYGAQLKDPRKDKIADSVGAMDLNPGLAYKKTLGEIIERYCQLYPKEGELKAFDNYSNLGEHALDPSNLFPFENQNLDVCTKYLHWVSVKNLQTQRYLLAPSRLVYLNQDPYDPELDSIRTTNGTSFGYTIEEAVLGGFCEILERDAFFIQYLTKSTPPRVEISNIENRNIELLVDYFSRYSLEVHLFDISLEFEPYIVMAIIIDKSGIGPSIGIGSSCGIDPNRTIINALLEAQQIRLYSRRLKLQSDNKPFNDQLKDKALSWYGKEKIEQLDFFLNSDRFVQLNNGHKSKEEILREFPHDIYVCDLSLPSMDNYKAVKIIIPKCFPLYFDDSRMPINLSRFNKYLGKREINDISHPFI